MAYAGPTRVFVSPWGPSKSIPLSQATSQLGPATPPPKLLVLFGSWAQFMGPVSTPISPFPLERSLWCSPSGCWLFTKRSLSRQKEMGRHKGDISDLVANAKRSTCKDAGQMSNVEGMKWEGKWCTGPKGRHTLKYTLEYNKVHVRMRVYRSSSRVKKTKGRVFFPKEKRRLFILKL